ncbi:urease accessory protein UreD [Yoonia sp. F2084L]|uniref:urease accessory protein UreD n=1 Tax=Yoonia sp. F2084L TaxID=2926419 RepID=UPI0032B1C9EA
MVLSAKRRGTISVIDELHQSGCMRVLFPHGLGALDAVLINTSGGVTGGDNIAVSGAVGVGSTLRLTTQASERAYRAQPHETARITTTLSVADGASLQWLPQEIILFEGCRLDRQLDLALAPGAKALLVEPVVFGRAAMGEVLTDIMLRDRIAITQDGQPIYLDRVVIDGDAVARLAGPATAGGMGAMASFVYAAPDADARIARVRALLPQTGGASLLADDLLVGRVVAADGYLLRRSLIPIIELLSGATVPKTWRL